jgi:hypothetical protein
MSEMLEDLNGQNSQKRRGIVLLVTLVLLIVLATLGYTLTTRVAAQRHRNQYIIDYSNARYACDSALKYALASLEDIQPTLISRPNEPDFSDVFTLTKTEYEEVLNQWLTQSALTAEGSADNEGVADFNDIETLDAIGDANDTNDVNDVSYDPNAVVSFGAADSATIRGPYGPAWPYVVESMEVEIGSAKVRIEIEDENAKYPIGWALLNDPGLQRQTEAGFEVFCEWMMLERDEIALLKEQLNAIGQLKPFKLQFKPIRKTVRIRSKTQRRTRLTRKTISPADQAANQNADFARLFHSSLLDTELLARPYMEGREESALKYLGMWASRTVNINTAPRHVLEAAFTFGSLSDAPEIAQEIIQNRRIQPFTDVDDLKNMFPGYADTIRECEQYITTASRFFTIRVTAVSGVAEASAVVAITKEGNKIKEVAVISG